MLIDYARYKDRLPVFWADILYHQIKDKAGNLYGIGFHRRHLELAKKWIYETEPSDSIAILFAKKKCAYCGTDLKFKVSVGDHIVGKKLEGVQWRVPCCKTCNSSKGNHDLIDWWVGMKKRDILEIDKHVWAVYVRAKPRLLIQENNFDQRCSSAFLTALDSLHVRHRISDYN